MIRMYCSGINTINSQVSVEIIRWNLLYRPKCVWILFIINAIDLTGSCFLKVSRFTNIMMPVDCFALGKNPIFSYLPERISFTPQSSCIIWKQGRMTAPEKTSWEEQNKTRVKIKKYPQRSGQIFLLDLVRRFTNWI